MRAREALTVAGVSAYMLGVAGWLRLTRQVRPEHSLAALCYSRARADGLALAGRLMGRPPEGELSGIQHDREGCWVGRLPWWAQGEESDRLGRSSLVLFEDGQPLGPAHQLHADIASLGGGRYSHWDELVYFSSSDGSDPRSNGRRYVFRFAPPA